MSSIKLSPNASGTGIFTVAAPNSNTDRTLTLPDNTGTLLSSASTIAPSQLGSQFSINASAPSNSFVMDASGRITMPNQPAFRAELTTTTLYTNTTSDIAYNSTFFNTGNHYSTTTGLFTAPVAGRYAFFIRGFAEVAGRICIDLRVNGTPTTSTYGAQEQGDLSSTMAVVNLAANDTVAARLRSGTMYGGGGYDTAQFMGYLIG